VVADPSLIDVAVEETLRFEAPVASVFRANLAEQTVADVTLPVKSKAQCMLGAANRDPAVFTDPDSYRLDRDLRHLRAKTLAFGHGPHTCVGASLGRLGGQTAVRVLAERLPGLRPADPPPAARPYVVPQSVPTGLLDLHVAWEVP
jgi:cytochrome P450